MKAHLGDNELIKKLREAGKDLAKERTEFENLLADGGSSITDKHFNDMLEGAISASMEAAGNHMQYAPAVLFINEDGSGSAAEISALPPEPEEVEDMMLTLGFHQRRNHIGFDIAFFIFEGKGLNVQSTEDIKNATEKDLIDLLVVVGRTSDGRINSAVAQVITTPGGKMFVTPSFQKYDAEADKPIAMNRMAKKALEALYSGSFTAMAANFTETETYKDAMLRRLLKDVNVDV